MDANKAEKTLTLQSNETGLEKDTTYQTLSLIQYWVQYLLLISRFLHFAASFCRKSNILSNFPPCDYLPRPDVLHLCFLSYSLRFPLRVYLVCGLPAVCSSLWLTPCQVFVCLFFALCPSALSAWLLFADPLFY